MRKRTRSSGQRLRAGPWEVEPARDLGREGEAAEDIAILSIQINNLTIVNE
jgi:hypothetical protein